MRSRKPLEVLASLAAAVVALAVLPATAPPVAADDPLPPSITVALDSIPDSAQDITFTGCLGSGCGQFVLDDDDDPTRPSFVSAGALAPGTYTVQQSPVAAWTLVDIDCDTGEDVDLASGTATIVLEPGEQVLCTFYDRAPGIRIVEESGSGHDLGFTGCATAGGCSPFTLDDDADPTNPDRVVAAPLPPGSYTITQDADAAWPLTSLSCTTGESVDLANRRVTIDLGPTEVVTCTFTNVTQTLTIVQDTEPDAAYDFTYTGCLGTGCASFALDDDADPTLPSSVTGAELAPGTYTVTQEVTGDYDLLSLSCAPNESTSLATRTATVTLSPGEHVTCTFRDVPGGPTVPATSIVAGHQQACAVLGAGEARCWGENGARALGDGTTTDRPLPTAVSDPIGVGRLTGVTQVDTAGSSTTVGSTTGRTCARLESGQARCWGSDSRPLGDAAGTTVAALPLVVTNATGTGPLLGVAEVGTGMDYSCARVNRQVRCWGAGLALGDGTAGTVVRTRPTPVVDVDGEGPLTGVVQLSVGSGHACAVVTSGQVRCWGANERGQLGNGGLGSGFPVVVSDPQGTGPLTGVTEVSAGNGMTCARLSSGEARCWGQYVGDGTSTTRNRPVPLLNETGSAPLAGVAHVSAGGGYGPTPSGGDNPFRGACVALTSGEARCWGQTPTGDGTSVTRLRPVPVLASSGVGPLTGVVDVSVGAYNACALLAGGEARCWGRWPGDGSGASARPGGPVLVR